MTLANRLKSKINLCLLCKQIEQFYFHNLNTYLKRTRQDQSDDTTPRFSSAVLLFAACRDAACAAILRAVFRGTRKSYRGTARQAGTQSARGSLLHLFSSIQTNHSEELGAPLGQV